MLLVYFFILMLQYLDISLRNSWKEEKICNIYSNLDTIISFSNKLNRTLKA